MDKLSNIAARYAACFKSKSWDNGETFLFVEDSENHPELMGLIQDCHGDLMPDDYVYTTVSEAFDEFADAGLDDSFDLDRRCHVIENLEPDCYTAQLTAWLASNINRVYYMTEALQEFGPFNDAFKLLGTAQWLEKREIYEKVAEFLRDCYDAQEDAE